MKQGQNPVGDRHFESIVSISQRNQKDKAAVATRRISAITIGVRHRRDLGDIEGLAVSIAEVGLLHPVVITPGNVLIAGARRLAACAFLLWREVPVTVVDIDKVVKGEFAEDSELGDAPPARPRQGAAHARQGRGNRRHRLARGRRQGVPIANRLLNGGQS